MSTDSSSDGKHESSTESSLTESMLSSSSLEMYIIAGVPSDQAAPSKSIGNVSEMSDMYLAFIIFLAVFKVEKFVVERVPSLKLAKGN